MAKPEFTEEHKDFIRNNRLKMSIKKMCVEIGIGYTRVRGFMVEENLTLTKEEKKNRINTLIAPPTKMDPVKWVPEPWNENLNLVTMRR